MSLFLLIELTLRSFERSDAEFAEKTRTVILMKPSGD